MVAMSQRLAWAEPVSLASEQFNVSLDLPTHLDDSQRTQADSVAHLVRYLATLGTWLWADGD
jgi:hypothetical protein